MTNQAVSAQGSSMSVSVDNGATWLPIKQLDNFPLSSGKADKLDASNLDSEEKEYINGLKDHGDVSLTGQRVNTDPGQNALRDNAGGAAILKFKGSFSNGEQATWDAPVASFESTAGTNKILMFTAVIWPRNYNTVS